MSDTTEANGTPTVAENVTQPAAPPPFVPPQDPPADWLARLPNPDLGPTLWRYVAHGIAGDGFTMALMRNSLRDAVKGADQRNLPIVPAWIDWMLGELPAVCWGSDEAVRVWIAHGGLAGRPAAVARSNGG
jgi:hypothetical protein